MYIISYCFVHEYFANVKYFFICVLMYRQKQ